MIQAFSFSDRGKLCAKELYYDSLVLGRCDAEATFDVGVRFVDASNPLLCERGCSDMSVPQLCPTPTTNNFPHHCMQLNLCTTLIPSFFLSFVC